MYKINIFQIANGTWVYSFSIRSYGQLENSKQILYDINFPLVLALKAIVTKHETLGYIYGPEFCENCINNGSEENVIVSFCTYCTKYLCVGSLEQFSCECNTNGISIQSQLNEQSRNYIQHGVWAIGCIEKCCIFKTYLNNKNDKNLSIECGFTSLMSDVLNITNDFISSPISLHDLESESLIPNTPYDESFYISDVDSIESEKVFKPRLAIIHPDDLEAQPKQIKYKYYDEEIGSSDSTEDLNITSSTEKSKIMAKRVALYDLTQNDDSDCEIEGESIVFTPKKKL